MDIGHRIRSCREACGMSQTELARALWVSRNTIGNWESGATTPDIESFVLMSALFGVSIDTMVREDERVMASVIARDRNHLLAVSRTGTSAVDGVGDEAALNITMPEPVADPVLGSYSAIEADATDTQMPAIRLVRSWAIFNGAHYHLEEHGRRIGTIHRGRALYFPYFRVKVDGFSRVMLRRDYHMDRGIAVVYRLEGENLSLTGNVLGPAFGVMRAGKPLVDIAAIETRTHLAFSIEIADEQARTLALGVTLALLLMRDFDRNLVRDA